MVAMAVRNEAIPDFRKVDSIFLRMANGIRIEVEQQHPVDERLLPRAKVPPSRRRGAPTHIAPAKERGHSFICSRAEILYLHKTPFRRRAAVKGRAASRLLSIVSLYQILSNYWRCTRRKARQRQQNSAAAPCNGNHRRRPAKRKRAQKPPFSPTAPYFLQPRPLI